MTIKSFLILLLLGVSSSYALAQDKPKPDEVALAVVEGE